MPIYEYECQQCHEITEELQKFSDPPLKKCPHCGGRLTKVMSLNAFHLKGGGWYVTDYKGKNSSNTSNGDKAGDSGQKKAKAKADKD